MRQGNGSDLLGMNDPRSTSVGIIYVAPNDDRKSVLAAILTQEKLGRRQIAIVLPPQNKAFQRPGDFEDLKSMRHRLQAQIIFIAPGGQAEFARQRRFTVYSSLENYGQALRDESVAGNEGKKPWLFGAKASTGEKAKNGKGKSTTPVTPVGKKEPAGAYSSTSDDDNVRPFLLGGAAGMAAGAAMSNMAPTPQVAQGPTDGGSLGHQGAFPDDDDFEIAPPDPSYAASGTPGPAAPKPAANANDVAGGPPIIELPPGGKRITTPLSEAELLSIEDQQSSSKPKGTKRNSQQLRLRNGTKGVAAGATTHAAVPVPTGRSSVANGGSRGSVGVPPGAPPPVPAKQDKPARRRWPWAIGLLALLLLTSLLVCLGVASAQPNLMSQVPAPVSQMFGAPPKATITITPDSQVVENNYVITGVTTAANAQQRQVGVRSISGKATMQPKTVNATGVAKTEAAAAKGNITFFNLNDVPTTISSGTIFDLGGGLRVVTDQAANIPAGNPPTAGFVSVPAHVEPTGAAGNIGALTINQGCCTPGVTARNTQAFTGGQDPKDYKFVQQADIDGVINSSKDQLVQQANGELNKQLKAGEKIAGSPQCDQKAGANQKAGDEGVNVPNVTVNLEVTCTGLAYNQVEVETLAGQLLQRQVSNDTKLTPGYALGGKVLTQTTVQGVNQGRVNLLVNAKGLWVFQVDDAVKQAWAQQLAGKELEQARTLIKSMRGVKDATIDFSGTTLPTDLALFTFTINPVNPLPGSSGTSPAGTPTVTGGDGNAAPEGTPKVGNG